MELMEATTWLTCMPRIGATCMLWPLLMHKTDTSCQWRGRSFIQQQQYWSLCFATYAVLPLPFSGGKSAVFSQTITSLASLYYPLVCTCPNAIVLFLFTSCPSRIKLQRLWFVEGDAPVQLFSFIVGDKWPKGQWQDPKRYSQDKIRLAFLALLDLFRWNMELKETNGQKVSKNTTLLLCNVQCVDPRGI